MYSYSTEATVATDKTLIIKNLPFLAGDRVQIVVRRRKLNARNLRANALPSDELVQRVPGLHLGGAWISSDFDEPLPDGFWTGAQ